MNKILNHYQVVPVCINDIAHVETDDANKLDEILKETDYLSKVAQEINCPTIQLVPLLALEGRPWKEIVQITGAECWKNWCDWEKIWRAFPNGTCRVVSDTFVIEMS